MTTVADIMLKNFEQKYKLDNETIRAEALELILDLKLKDTRFLKRLEAELKSTSAMPEAPKLK